MKYRCFTYLLISYLWCGIAQAVQPYSELGSEDRNWVMSGRLPYAVPDLAVRQDSIPMTIDYFDGLGRKVQSTAFAYKCGRVGRTDFVEYDAMSRVSRRWLPMVSADETGSFTPLDYLKECYEAPASAFTSFSYEQRMEGRPLESVRPGTAHHAAPHGITHEYTYNTASTLFTTKRYKYIDDGIYQRGTFAPLELFVHCTTDEDNNQLLEFTNPLGMPLLRREHTNDGQILSTHFIYDPQGRLRLIVPPAAALHLKSNNQVPATYSDLKPDCYLFDYDALGRCIRQSVPGGGTTYHVYTEGGKLAFSSDEVMQASGKGFWYLYDVFGRQVLQGAGTLPAQDVFALEEGTFPKAMTRFDKNDDTAIFGYIPVSGIENEADVLSADFYDDYTFLDLFPDLKRRLSYSQTPLLDERGEETHSYFKPKGHLTGSLRRVLGDTDKSKYLLTVYYYDHNGRVIQSRSTNHLGGLDILSYKLSFDGLPLHTHLDHTSDSLSTIIEHYYKYSDSRRPILCLMRRDCGQWTTLKDIWYDDLDRVSDVNLLRQVSILYDYTAEHELELIRTEAFTQHLFREKRPDGTQGCLNGNLSGQIFTLNQIKESQKKGRALKGAYSYQYAGNRLKKATYAEAYRREDPLTPDRFLREAVEPDYSVSYSYGEGGEPTSIVRRGMTSTSLRREGTDYYMRSYFGEIDNLAMTYAESRLKKVSDSADDITMPTAVDFNDGADQDTEYEYDAMGRLTADHNKGAVISYNVLGLPSDIVVGDSHIKLVYSSDGTLLARRYGTDRIEWKDPIIGLIRPFAATASATDDAVEVKRYQQLSRRDYCGDFIYADGRLERMLHEAGWMNPDGGHTAQICDWQGNVRATWTQGDVEIGSGTTGPTTLKRYDNLTAYYPYGLPFSDWQGTDRYLYSGKELERADGLQLYDFHARLYDPQLALFHIPDPLATQTPATSPYLYCAANPIAHIDPTGLTHIYGAEGEHYKDIDDGKDYSVMLINVNEQKQLVKGDKETYDRLYQNKQYIYIDQNMLSNMEQAKKLTAKNDIEYGFTRYEDGTYSEMQSGTASNINLETKLDGNGKPMPVSHDVHTHPINRTWNEKDGKWYHGMCGPSNRDIEDNRSPIDIVLAQTGGWQTTPYNPSPITTKDIKPTFTSSGWFLSIYNNRGEIVKVKYNSFIDLARKILKSQKN